MQDHSGFRIQFASLQILCFVAEHQNNFIFGYNMKMTAQSFFSDK